MLLAQGDFAAFLDADAKDRAELLERMTGTEIYGADLEARRTSGRCASGSGSKARERGELVTRPRRRRAAPSWRGRWSGSRSARSRGRAARARRGAGSGWHAQLDGLRREEAEAREDREQVVRQLALAESRRRELEAYAKALPVKPLLEALDRALRLAEKRAGEVEKAEEERDRAHVRAEATREAHEAANRAALDAEGAVAEAAPALLRARLLDRDLAELRAGAAKLEESAAQREQAARQAAERRAKHEAELARHRAEVERAGIWLAAHTAAEAAAERWDRDQERLGRAVELRGDLDARQKARREAAAAVERAGREAEERAEAARGAREAATAAEKAWREADDVARSAPSESLAEARGTWMTRRTRLEEALGVVATAQSAYSAERRHREAADNAEAARSAALDDAKRAEEQRHRALAQLEEARHARDRLRSTLDLAGYRAELREGEPCPLCGATDHPYAHEQPALEGLLVEQDARIRELADRLTQVEARHVTLHGAADAQAEKRRDAEVEAAEWARDLAAARERYAEVVRALDVRGGGRDPHGESGAENPGGDRGGDWAGDSGRRSGPTSLEIDVEGRAGAVVISAEDIEERTRRPGRRSCRASPPRRSSGGRSSPPRGVPRTGSSSTRARGRR